MATRVYEKLGFGVWVPTEPEKLANGDVIHILDDGTPVGLAPELVGDTKIYRVAHVDHGKQQVAVPVHVPVTGVVEKVAAFTG